MERLHFHKSKYMIQFCIMYKEIYCFDGNFLSFLDVATFRKIVEEVKATDN